MFFWGGLTPLGVRPQTLRIICIMLNKTLSNKGSDPPRGQTPIFVGYFWTFIQGERHACAAG